MKSSAICHLSSVICHATSFRRVAAAGLGLLVVVTTLCSTQAENAAAAFQSIKEKLHAARTSKDWKASLVSANQLKQLLHEAPESILEVARAEVHTGDLNGAFRELAQFVRMGQSTDLLETSPEFAPLRQQAGFAGIQNGMKNNGGSISRASEAFRLPDPALLAEDLDYDATSKRFFITSVREKKIVSTDSTGATREFAKAPDDWPMLAIKVDPSRGVLWATEVALQGFVFTPKSDWGRSAVLCYDLKDGRLLHRIEGPRDSGLGDMALTADGDVVVSDGDGGGVYRVQAKEEALQRLDGGDFISPQTPAMHPDGKHIFVPDYLRGIGLLDIATKQVRWLAVDGSFALNGVDGLYLNQGKLIAVQNGTSPKRVLAFKLDEGLTRIRSETIIERSTESLGDPTHGVVVGRDFYYIANSGWDVIDDHGNLKAGAKLSEARIMRVSLEAL